MALDDHVANLPSIDGKAEAIADGDDRAICGEEVRHQGERSRRDGVDAPSRPGIRIACGGAQEREWAIESRAIGRRRLHRDILTGHGTDDRRGFAPIRAQGELHIAHLRERRVGCQDGEPRPAG